MAAVAPPLQWCVPIIDCELIHAFVCHCMLDLANAMRYEPPMPDHFTLFTQWSGPMMRVREVCYLANNKHNYERTIFPQSSMQLCILPVSTHTTVSYSHVYVVASTICRIHQVGNNGVWHEQCSFKENIGTYWLLRNRNVCTVCTVSQHTKQWFWEDSWWI